MIAPRGLPSAAEPAASPPPPAAAASTPDAARVTVRPSAPAPVPTPAALPHPIAAAAARQANLRRPPQRVHLHLPPAAQHLPLRSESGLERQHEVTGSAYGLQPHRPVSDVRTVVSAAVVLSPPCGWQLAPRISTPSGAVHLFREHLRATAVTSAYGGTRPRVGVPRFLVANGALSKSSMSKRSASFRQAQVLHVPDRSACERARGMCTWRWLWSACRAPLAPRQP